MKAALPALMKLIDLIPLSWRTPLTIVFGAFILVDAYMTTTSLNYWFERRAGVSAETPVTQFYAHNFGHEFMQTRFETMSMFTELAKR